MGVSVVGNREWRARENIPEQERYEALEGGSHQARAIETPWPRLAPIGSLRPGEGRIPRWLPAVFSGTCPRAQRGCQGVAKRILPSLSPRAFIPCPWSICSRPTRAPFATRRGLSGYTCAFSPRSEAGSNVDPGCLGGQGRRVCRPGGPLAVAGTTMQEMGSGRSPIPHHPLIAVTTPDAVHPPCIGGGEASAGVWSKDLSAGAIN